MCTLLRPDIIVASKVNDSFETANLILDDIRRAVEHVYITVESCLTHQENCKNRGIENVFTGNSEKDWGAKEYEEYFERFPQYFEKESSESPLYKVKLLQMAGEDAMSDRKKVTVAICKELLDCGRYSPRTLCALGFRDYVEIQMAQ